MRLSVWLYDKPSLDDLDAQMDALYRVLNARILSPDLEARLGEAVHTVNAVRLVMRERERA